MDIVFNETRLILPSVILMVICGIGFALFGYFSINVALCLVFGTVYSLANFFFIGVSL